MIREISIKNFKSILDHTIELGRTNVFIGENGSGKSNILEAVATASAALGGKLDIEELYARGVRVSKPSSTISSFLHTKPAQKIELAIHSDVNAADLPSRVQITLAPEDVDDINATWRVEKSLPADFARKMAQKVKDRFEKYTEHALERLISIDELRFLHVSVTRLQELESFCIYNLDPLALRGIHVVSRRAPLGIHGENLDVFLSSFDKNELRKLTSYGKVVSWLDRLVLDTEDEMKLQGHKLGRSVSTLYFRDRFMRKKNNIFSAENANEGILHILFYLALFLSDKTPPFFGIDNIETALNPQLCRELMKTISELARENDKQALITTHNPAILDGLDLHDDEQRLFVVYRNDQGHTVTKRIKLKPDTGESKYKLSELWMRGHLGGLPRTF